MRKKYAALAVVAGLGAVALAAPMAQADGGYGDTTISGAAVNGGQDVVIGVSAAKTFNVVVSGHDDSGLEQAETDVEGPGYGYFDHVDTCQKATSCTSRLTIDPQVDLMNSNAGTWYVGSWVDANDGDYLWKERIGSWHLKRAARLTVNASPEPVKKGRTITVTGTLTRASWDDYRYHGYTGQTAKLQFRKKGSSTFNTVKTVKTNSSGALRTTVVASADGYWRYSFAGTSTTGTVTATSDYVDVR